MVQAHDPGSGLALMLRPRPRITDFDHTAIDELLHRRVRLAIVAFLVGATAAAFAAVCRAIDTTDSNARVHLRKLEDAGYIMVEKRFVARKPHTLYALTESGGKALLDYVTYLESLLKPGSVPDRQPMDGR